MHLLVNKSDAFVIKVARHFYSVTPLFGQLLFKNDHPICLSYCSYEPRSFITNFRVIEVVRVVLVGATSAQSFHSHCHSHSHHPCC